ncbi:MAG: NAD(P)-binding domain-containing protein, partial [Bacteroidota bacterium]
MKKFSEALIQTLEGDALSLSTKVVDKSAVVGVVGLGYVGMPIALEYAKKGFQVIGVDVSTQKVEALNRGENFIEDLVDAEVEAAVGGGLLRATTDYAELEAAH